MYIHKWIKKDGSLLTMGEYKMLLYSAQIQGIPMEEYFQSVGIVENMSYGEIQEPHNNSARLVSWYKIDDGKFKLLTFWRYAEYLEESKKEGKDIGEYLREKGFKRLIEYKKNGDSPTRWINLYNGGILYRKEYLKLFNEAKKVGVDFKMYLKNLGYVNILESKKKYKVMEESDEV